MACFPINGPGFHGFLCGPDYVVDLRPYGSAVWMTFHRALGPTFYRGQHSDREIRAPGKKTWNAFDAWHKSMTAEQKS